MCNVILYYNVVNLHLEVYDIKNKSYTKSRHVYSKRILASGGQVDNLEFLTFL